MHTKLPPFNGKFKFLPQKFKLSVRMTTVFNLLPTCVPSISFLAQAFSGNINFWFPNVQCDVTCKRFESNCRLIEFIVEISHNERNSIIVVPITSSLLIQ